MDPIRRKAIAFAIACVCLVFGHGSAWAQSAARVHVDIRAQSLSTALADFGRQAGVEIIFTPDAVRSLSAPRVEGTYTPDEALTRLLEGSGLSFRQGSDGAYVVSRAKASPKSTTQTSVGLEEVIVTARKREESLLEIPSSVTAIGSAELAYIGAAGFDDFVRLAPGLTMVPTSTNPNFSIRGISTSTTIGTTQAPISLYVDETPTQDPFVALSSFNLYLADVNRVEVLRGPQGTLFGSGSLSGAIRVITNKPDPSDFSGYVKAGMTSIQGGETGGQFEAMANVPLGETTALRVLAYDRHTGGYIDNISQDKDNVNDMQTTGARIALRSDVTSKLSITGSVIYQLDKTDDGSRTFYTASQGDSDQWDSLQPDVTRFENGIGNLLVTYDLGWASLTSSSSYLKRTEHTKLDASPDLAPLLGVPGTPVYSDNDNKSENFVEELRLTSQLDGPLSYVAGAYYSEAKRHTHTLIRAPVLESIIGVSSLLQSSLHSTIKEAALFGELRYAVTDTFELAAGLRAFHNEVQVDVDNSGLLVGPPVLLNRSNDDDSYTPRFTATWQASDDLMVYAQIAKGYRLGQANVAAGPPIYESDTLWNYEVGTKGVLFDKRLEFSVAAFYIDWDNLQVGLRPPGTVFLYTGNAGSARSVGLELEGIVHVADGFDFQTALAFDDAVLTESIPNLPQPSGVLGVEDGDRLPGAPRFTMSNALIYSHVLGNDISGRLRLDHQYVGGSYNTFTEDSALKIGDFNVFNLSGTVDFGRVNVDAFVKNIGNSDGVTNANFDLGLDTIRAAWRLPPRTYGVAVTVNF